MIFPFQVTFNHLSTEEIAYWSEILWILKARAADYQEKFPHDPDFYNLCVKKHRLVS